MITHPFIDLSLLILLIALLIMVIVRLRNKTLALWNEVTRLELTFHKKLFESLHLFLSHKNQFEHHAHYHYYDILSKYKDESAKALSLADRQDIFKALQALYLCIDEGSHPAQITLKNQFDELQSCRLKYNSKVLYYNHFIQSFPMNLLAKRMHFDVKKYFG